MFKEWWGTLFASGFFNRRKNSEDVQHDRRRMTAKRSEDVLRQSIEELDRTVMRRRQDHGQRPETQR